MFVWSGLLGIFIRLGEGEGGRLAPIERLVRQHLKAVDEFVRQIYPSVQSEPFVHAVFESARKAMPIGDDLEVRLQLFGQVRASIRRLNRETWPNHNARIVRERMLDAGSVMTDWHAWSDLNRLLACLKGLSPDQQEVLRITSLYSEIGPNELATVLRIGPTASAQLLDGAAAALRAAFDDDDPVAQVDGVER